MAFPFRLQTADGASAEPPTLTSAVPNWRPATRSRSAAGRCEWYTSATRGRQPPVLVVEDVAG
jgi:hypothetical protein